MCMSFGLGGLASGNLQNLPYILGYMPKDVDCSIISKDKILEIMWFSIK